MNEQEQKAEKDKIALVLLHGIGEQRPMETLRSFVKGVFGKEGRSKPDRLSDNFEVRKLTLAIDKKDIHCYELYWAHHMHSSTLRHIAKWLWRLVWTPSHELRKQACHINESFYTRTKPWILGGLLALALFVVAMSVLLDKLPGNGGWAGAFVAASISLVVGLVWSFLHHQMVEVVGDAARYLDSAPANVGIRQTIRAECVRFLEKLLDAKLPEKKVIDKEQADNDKPLYSRIIVLGHSLGSVIAYDALKLLWAGMEPHAAVPLAESQPGEDLEKLYSASPSAKQDAPSPQRQLFKKLLPTGDSWWRISDLVTVGSPLTHAPLLLAKSVGDFDRLKEQRELPTSPPQRDNCTGLCGYKDGQSFGLHHAAVFAVVHWTNLYFPSDPIGGPLAPIFGDGIDDIALGDAPRGSWLDHTRYWDESLQCGSSEFKNHVLRLLGNGTLS